MAMEELAYKGARLRVQTFGRGWMVLVYLPGSNLAQVDIPNTRDPGSREKVIREAKILVDRSVS